MPAKIFVAKKREYTILTNQPGICSYYPKKEPKLTVAVSSVQNLKPLFLKQITDIVWIKP